MCVMAVLPDLNRKAVWQRVMQRNREPWGDLAKTDLRSAVDAIDNNLHTNASTINQWFPQPARGELTLKQKALILAACAEEREFVEPES